FADLKIKEYDDESRFPATVHEEATSSRQQSFQPSDEHTSRIDYMKHRGLSDRDKRNRGHYDENLSNCSRDRYSSRDEDKLLHYNSDDSPDKISTKEKRKTKFKENDSADDSER